MSGKLSQILVDNKRMWDINGYYYYYYHHHHHHHHHHYKPNFTSPFLCLLMSIASLSSYIL